MPQPSKTAERRREIVRGLMRAMAKRGYAGAPISAIASEAGLTAGLVHYYFESKQAILLALLQAIHATVLERYESRLTRAGTDPWERLGAFVDALLEADDSPEGDEAAACWVAIAAEAVHEPAVRERFRSMLDDLRLRLTDHLSDVLEAEGRSTDELESAAAALTALVHGIHQLDAAVPENAPAGSSAPLARQLIAGFVAAQPPGRRGRGRSRKPRRAGRARA